MNNKFILLIITLFSFSHIYSLNFITTAESIAWNGAYTSVSDGFEAMLYNPAGLFMTSTKYGINIFGTYGFRAYSNSLTTDHMLKIFKTMEEGRNLTTAGILTEILFLMPENGLDIGIDVSAGNFMTYSKMKEFSYGISVLPKTNVTFNVNKGLFSSIFNQIDLTTEKIFKAKSVIMQYIDLNFMLSTRAKFIEKVMPQAKAVYVGMGIHVYLPTVFMILNSNLRVRANPAGPSGAIDSYSMRVDGSAMVGANGGLMEILKYIPSLYEKGGSFINYGGGAAFGLGLDFGCIIEFSESVRFGFSITDIGFMVFPRTAIVDLDYSTNIDFNNLASFGGDFVNGFFGALSDSSNGKQGEVMWWMPSTAIRVGISICPFKSDVFMWSSDISLLDLNRVINGEYPTFNFSTGIEFKPSYKWFAMPIRTAFNYNSQANLFSLSFGIGLYLGPVEMDIGVKGIEILISELGAKEICAGVDLKFEF